MAAVVYVFLIMFAFELSAALFYTVDEDWNFEVIQVASVPTLY